MASLVSTATKHFMNTMAGAPVLNNAAGGLIAILDAVLITGFGTKNITSMVITAGVATINFAAPASAASPKAVIAITGITGTYAALNGEQRVKSVSTTSVTFLTDMADGTATLSSATFKIAPLGWEKVFSGTNKAVYRPTDPASTRPYYRVLDTAASPATVYSARVTMYETMTDVDTGTNPAPTAARVADGLYMWKTNVNGVTAQAWTIVGDSRGFYWCPCTHFSANPATVSAVAYFGDGKSFRSSDAYCGTIVSPPVEVNGNAPSQIAIGVNSATSYAGHVLRASSGLGSSVVLAWRGMGSGTTTAGSGNDANGMGPHPNPSTNGVILGEILWGQAPLETFGPRGVWPGAAFVPMLGTRGYYPRGTFIDGMGPFAGAKMMSIPACGNLSATDGDFAFFIDVTRDWRA